MTNTIEPTPAELCQAHLIEADVLVIPHNGKQGVIYPFDREEDPLPSRPRYFRCFVLTNNAKAYLTKDIVDHWYYEPTTWKETIELFEIDFFREDLIKIMISKKIRRGRK